MPEGSAIGTPRDSILCAIEGICPAPTVVATAATNGGQGMRASKSTVENTKGRIVFGTRVKAIYFL